MILIIIEFLKKNIKQLLKNLKYQYWSFL